MARSRDLAHFAAIGVAVGLLVAAAPALTGWLRRLLVAWAANLYLRVAGITGRY